MNGDTIFRVTAAAIIVAFYAVYFGKMLAQRRQGIRTGLVTGGIFRVSRNPAVLAFDLVYVGVLAICFNPILATFSLWSMIMLHLQIREEEKFLTGVFGEPYTNYMNRTRRYIGTKQTK
jgi:protein-S-isoprenylcysteine O-methyltransferase Ste14